MNFLENNLLRLRAPEPEDVAVLYRWENDTSIWQAGITMTPFSKDILKKYIETAHLDVYQTRQLRFIIDLKEKKHYRPIGTIDLFDFEPQHLRAGVGILIAESSDRSKGYASKALDMLIHYCFQLMGLHQLYCNISPENKKSIMLFTKHGFVQTGVKKQWNRKGMHWTNEIFFQLINPDHS